MRDYGDEGYEGFDGLLHPHTRAKKQALIRWKTEVTKPS
jgi:hypothetical protein